MLAQYFNDLEVVLHLFWVCISTSVSYSRGEKEKQSENNQEC